MASIIKGVIENPDVDLFHYFMERKDFKKAIDIFEKEELGEHLPCQNYLYAKKYMLIAARQNYPDALYELGKIYTKDGDFIQAARCYKRAIGRGHRIAIQKLKLHLEKYGIVYVDYNVPI